MYFEIAQSLSERFAVGIKLKTTQVFDKIGVKYQKEDIQKILEQIDINSYFLGATLEEVVDILVD